MNSFISQDITFCMSNECPIRKYCFRAIGCTKRIASYSDFYKATCNHSNVYKMFIQAPMDLVKNKRNQRKDKEC